jgi:nitrite reductase/ring-hydroxylating ferredoxin subunit
MTTAACETNSRWYPICALEDLAPQHVFETELLGVDLAVWRSREGEINVWYNRCPHRGVRLTLGANLGSELRCAYHGYRFASGSGRCLALPAHPDRSPPATMRVRTLAHSVHGGLIWTSLDSDMVGPPKLSPLLDGSTSDLYPQHIAAPLAAVTTALAQHAWDLGEMPAEASVVSLLQPVNSGHTVIHGVLVGHVDAMTLQRLRRAHATSLAGLRRVLEMEESG